MYMFTYDTYIRLPTCILAPRDTCMHACMHTYIRITYIRKHYIHTHIRPPTRIPAAHAHTHAQTHHFSHQRHTQCARAQAVSLTHSLSRSPFPSHSLSISPSRALPPRHCWPQVATEISVLFFFVFLFFCFCSFLSPPSIAGRR
jgi:hypothetical protein